MDKQRAQAILTSIEAGSPLPDIRVFGNKGRLWNNTACITELDDHKDQCNPRLSSNHCTAANVGCPECMAKLREIANSEIKECECCDNVDGEKVFETEGDNLCKNCLWDEIERKFKDLVGLANKADIEIDWVQVARDV